MRNLYKKICMAGCFVAGVMGMATHPAAGQQTESPDMNSPWGIASGAEWAKDYPRFNPMLSKAGVRWLRLFPEWQTIQTKPGEFNWEPADRMVADAKSNGIHLTGGLWFFARFASADGGTRKGPIKDMNYWKDYVTASATRYKSDIRYWEVWNEFNGSFYSSDNKVKDYADLTVAAYDAIKKVDPNLQVGMSVANFDVGFLDAAIKAGAANHFDFICVHPYENLGAVAEGGEVGYLSLVGNLRDMLKANKQNADTPLWITEIGYLVPTKADQAGDAKQAEMLVKSYILSIAQGFKKIFWFEARGPSYGKNLDHGIIRSDWSIRPSYTAMGAMTAQLGDAPVYLGWLNVGPGGFGFVFQSQSGPVLAAWSRQNETYKTTFKNMVQVTSLTGGTSPLAAGNELVLSSAPVFVSQISPDLVAQAKANLGKPYPWGGDYAQAKTIKCTLGAVNKEDGLKQIKPITTVVENGLTDSWRRTDFANKSLRGEGHFVYFRVDPQFVPYGTKNLTITVFAKRVSPDKNAGMVLSYESATGYRALPGSWWGIPESDQWQEHTWTITDANFVGQWGWNFRLDALSSPNEFLIKELRVSK